MVPEASSAKAGMKFKRTNNVVRDRFLILFRIVINNVAMIFTI
jgi:hypothetical protein